MWRIYFCLLLTSKYVEIFEIALDNPILKQTYCGWKNIVLKAVQDKNSSA